MLVYPGEIHEACAPDMSVGCRMAGSPGGLGFLGLSGLRSLCGNNMIGIPPILLKLANSSSTSNHRH